MAEDTCWLLPGTSTLGVRNLATEVDGPGLGWPRDSASASRVFAEARGSNSQCQMGLPSTALESLGVAVGGQSAPVFTKQRLWPGSPLRRPFLESRANVLQHADSWSCRRPLCWGPWRRPLQPTRMALETTTSPGQSDRGLLFAWALDHAFPRAETPSLA